MKGVEIAEEYNIDLLSITSALYLNKNKNSFSYFYKSNLLHRFFHSKQTQGSFVHKTLDFLKTNLLQRFFIQ